MRNIFLGFVLALGLFGCSDEKPEEKAVVDFKVQLTNNGENISLGDTAHLEGEYDLYLSMFRLYLSRIALQSNSGESISLRDVVLLTPGSHSENSFSAEIPAGHYNQLKLGFGVDPQQNNSHPNDFENQHPLSSYQSMYWTMLKYRFAKLEGRAFLRTEGQNTNFSVSYHPGTDELYQTRSFDIDLNTSSKSTIELAIDLAGIMNGPGGKIDLVTEATTHSEPEDIHIAEKLMVNMAASAGVTIR